MSSNRARLRPRGAHQRLHNLRDWVALLIGVAGLAGLSWLDYEATLPLWLIVVMALLLVVIGWLISSRRGDALTVKWHTSLKAREEFRNALDDARQRVLIIGISHAGFYSDIERSLRSFLGNNPTGRIEAFVLNPECHSLLERAEDEATDAGATARLFKEEIDVNSRRLLGLSTEGRVSVHRYDWYPAWRMQLIDEDVIFAATYPKGERGFDADVMEVHKTQNPRLFATLRDVVRAYERTTTSIHRWAGDDAQRAEDER